MKEIDPKNRITLDDWETLLAEMKKIRKDMDKWKPLNLEMKKLFRRLRYGASVSLNTFRRCFNLMKDGILLSDELKDSGLGIENLLKSVEHWKWIKETIDQ